MQEQVFTRETVADGKIVCYRFHSTGTEAAEKWFTEVTDLFYGWGDEAPLLLLLDVRLAGNNLSADMMKAAREASQTRPDVKGKTAIIISGTESTMNIKILVDKVLAETRERRLYDNEPDAVAWLLEA